MKQRFSSLDVKVIAHELSNSLVTLRLANIYDLSSRIFLLKFAKPDNRQQMVIDSGFRCHLTSFSRTTAAAPSAFVARLRKFLRTRRVTSVKQIGTDRIIEIQFSEGQYRLYLEFYAGGNIVLTDTEPNVLALLRVVAEGPEHEQLRVGAKYSLDHRQNYSGIPPLTKERVKEALEKAVEKQQENAQNTAKKAKKGKGDSLRKALSVSITEYPPMLIEHALNITNFDLSLPPDEVLQDDGHLEKLLLALEEADKVVKDITSTEITKGYIIAKPARKSPNTQETAPISDESQSANLIYDDFHPFKPRQFEKDPTVKILEFDGFNKTVDEFFSSIEAQKLESRLQDREETAQRKLDAARQDHAKRLGGLQQVQQLNVQKAEAIEANLERVEEAMAAINGLIAQGMDWVEIARLIEMEQARHNPVAGMIKLPLKLYENTTTLLLDAMDFEDEIDYSGDETGSDVSDSDEEDNKKKSHPEKAEDKRLAVDIDLGLSPWANARQYYDQKKTAAVKEQKTLQSSTKALKSTERKVNADLKKGLKQEKQVLRPVRRQLWFEKFMFFISSDGYLVLGGKDAQQNEILYRRYLRRGDVYVHADLHGAALVIIKNKPTTPDAPIPPSTLSQAGNLSVVTSSAWDSKAVMSAWWVNSDQVSKSAPTGEYLTTGAFMIRGKKNFLPPAQLLLGFAVMFQISEESKARHVKHRLQDDSVAFGASSQEPDDKEAPAKGAGEDDHNDGASANSDSDDEDFPDAKIESGSDGGDDFPDAKIESGSDDDEGYDTSSENINPLQSHGKPLLPSRERQLSSEDRPKENDLDTKDTDEGEVGQVTPVESRDFSKDADQAKGSSGDGIRHLSARERRLLRKGQSTGDSIFLNTGNNNDNDMDDEADTSSAVGGDTSDAPSMNPKGSSSTTKISTANNKPTPKVRGKHGKQKKLALKYAAQDEEDRQLAMTLLGSAAAQEKAAADAQARKEKEADLAFQKARRREQHVRAQKDAKHHEEIRNNLLDVDAGLVERTAGDDGNNMPEDVEKAVMEMSTDLAAFTGAPLPGDELLAAVPVCAPWAALHAYKYKAKLQPGSVKKGKAVKEICARWATDARERKYVDESAADVERIWPREAELVGAWRVEEVVNVVPVSKVRLLMGGGGRGGGAAGGKTGAAGGAAAKGKGKGRGGRGSKRQR
ncbi:MAG: hypothetical protein M1819_002447 [Sarea resinae]|nr:MAG: hypothetical protein M1819_002447 [Sarea resinae]